MTKKKKNYVSYLPIVLKKYLINNNYALRLMKNKFLLFLILFISHKIAAQTASSDVSAEKIPLFTSKTTEKDSFSKENDLSEIVITAQRSATNRFSTAEAIDIIYSKNIENRQSRTTPEALTAINGVFIQKTNHGGGSPFLRGLTGNQTLLLVDGIRLNNATFRYGPNQYLNTIDPLSIERLEVLRGGGSVPYGSDALGGTIQIFTKNPLFSPKNAWNGQVFGKIMSQNMEQTGRASVGFSNKKMAVLGGLTYHNFGDLFGGDTTGRQSPTGYKELDFDLKARFLLKNNAVLTVAHQNIKQSNVPVFHKIQLENFDINEFEPQSRQLTYARLDVENNNRFFKKIYAIASLQNTEEGRNSRKNGSTVLRVENDKVRSLGLTINVLSEIWQNTEGSYSVNSGIDFYDDFVKSSRFDVDSKTNVSTSKRGLYPDNSTMASYAIFSLHSLKIKDWQLTFGGRFNGFTIKVADETLGKSTLNPSAFVWNGSILRGLTRHLNVFVSANSSFRAPNIDDLGTLGIVDFRYETPNFSLNPEKSHNFQVGFKYRNQKLTGETYVFNQQLRNLIARVRVDTQTVQGYALYRKENIEKSTIQGIETAWKYTYTEGSYFEIAAAYTHGQNLTKAEPMRRIPPLNGRFAWHFSKKRWFSTLETLGATKQNRLAQGDKDDNRIPKGGTPAWLICNVYGGYSFDNLNLNLAFQNLFNQDYRTHGSGVNGVGRSVSLSANCFF
jgi:hemoglobin/transferrin/lactoferrin receptor protein